MSDVDDLSEGIGELIEHADGYREAARYYEGNIDEVFSSIRLRRLLKGSNKLRLNLAKTPVDAVANKLAIRQVTATSKTHSNAQDVLDALIKSNKLWLEFPNMILNTIKYGDAYVILDGDETDGVSLFYNSPFRVRAIYDDDDPREMAFLVKRWRPRSMRGRVRANIWYHDHIDRYVTKNNECSGIEIKDFIPYTGDSDDDDEDAQIENEYGFIPGYHLRTDAPYGRPEHKDAYGPQDAINKLAITMMSTMDFHGAPQRWALMNDGKGTDDVDDFDDDIFHDDENPGQEGIGPNARHGVPVDSPSSLTSDAGGLWLLRNVKSVGQFGVAESDTFINPSEYLVRIMAQTTTTPLHYFDPSGDQPSGESLKVADMPLTNKTKHRRDNIDAGLNKAFVDALDVMGISDAEIALSWAPIEQASGTEDWALTTTKMANGVPVRQALMEAGYTSDQLDDWGVPESSYAAAGSSTFDTQADSLLKIGQAIQALGAAANLDLVTPEQINDLVAEFVRKESE